MRELADLDIPTREYSKDLFSTRQRQFCNCLQHASSEFENNSSYPANVFSLHLYLGSVIPLIFNVSILAFLNWFILSIGRFLDGSRPEAAWDYHHSIRLAYLGARSTSLKSLVAEVG